MIGRTILEMEGAEHLRHRRILTPFFSLRALRRNLEKHIEATTHELIDGSSRTAARTSCSSSPSPIRCG